MNLPSSTAHREKLIEELFSRVAGIANTEARSAFLRDACGSDMEMRRELEALLASHADSEPAQSLHKRQGPSVGEIGEQPGDRVGPFVLLDRLGEGGFGVVFAAEQKFPLRRSVAVKILKPGMDARQILLRFEQERHALSLMDHPHIARVLDAGATTSGRPFFAMELVRGEPITQFCDRHRLSIRERLRLFTKVCRGVHHAHQKGIIHRDLKPSNIIVDFGCDGEPEPKVIDFGIAKAMGGKLIDETLQTTGQQFLGTPAYTSPEQAHSGGTDIDTRSDIYSLGVLLHELLIGVTPRESCSPVNEARWRELWREIEIVNPSSRYHGLEEKTASRIASDRSAGPRELARQIAGDLDCIILKATAWKADERYTSAEACAADVERFVGNHSIEARRPSRLYRAGRFVRRHRTLVCSVFAVAIGVLGGAVAACWGWRLAQRESQIAVAESRKARELNDILFLSLMRADPGQGNGQDYTVRELLDDLGDKVDRDENMTPEVECALRDMLGFIYRETGDYPRALHHALRGLSLARQQPDDARRIASFLMTLGELSKEMDQLDDAERYLDECLSLRRQIFPEGHPTIIRTILSAARVHYKKGERAKGLAMVSNALAQARLHAGQPGGKAQLIRCLNMKALLLRDEARFQEAEAVNRERLELTREHYGDSHSDTLLAKMHLGSTLMELDQLGEGRALLSATLQAARTQLGDQYPLTLEAMIALAECHSRLGESERASALFAEAIELAGSRFSADFPDRRAWIERAVRFHQAQGHTARANELQALLPLRNF